MALAVTLNGSTYSVPEPGDVGYDQQLTNYLVALASAFPQLNSASTQALASEWDAGTIFGIRLPYAKSQTALPAISGFLRLAQSDSVVWRNAANSNDVSLGMARDCLAIGANNITGNPFLGANTGAGQSIPTGTTTIVVFGTVELDTDAGYSNTTGRYTIPVAKGGQYTLFAQVAFIGAPSVTLSIYKNGVEVKRTQALGAGSGISMPITATLVLAAGDVIDARATQSTGVAQTLSSTAALNFFTIKRYTT
jgi:hypothetical protein